MTTYVWRDGEVVEKSSAQVRRATHIISDTMNDTWHPATGKHVSSKSRFRQMTKDAGCQEIGNDSSLYRPRKPVILSRDERARDIKMAIEQLRSRGR